MTKEYVITELVDTMRQVWQLIRKQAFSSSSSPLTFLQRHSLRFLFKNPGITQKELATYFDMSASSAVQFVNRLDKLGLLTKRLDTKDKRITRLFLSRKGEEIWKSMQKQKQKTLVNALHGMMEEDIQEYLHLQKKFLEVLQKRS